MNMTWTSSKPELVSKLVQLAGGDIELVHRAIRANTKNDKPADLAKIVDFIVKNRKPAREKVPA
jgi:hypothetical protein